MTTKTILLFFGFALWAVFTAQAQLPTGEPMRFSLEQAYAYALEHNVSTVNARIDQEISQKKVWETTAIGLPQVNASAGYTNYIELMTTLIPAEFFGGPAGEFQTVQFGTKHNTDASLSVSQLIFSGEYIVGLQAARAYKMLSDKALVVSEQELKEQIAQIYTLALVLNENLSILDSTLTMTRQTYEETAQMYQAGMTEATAVDQLQLQVLTMENSRRSISFQVENTLRLLKYQMGLDLFADITLADSLTTMVEEALVSAVVNQTFDIYQNADYQMLEVQEALSELSLRREKSKFLPTLSANYVYQTSNMGDEFNLSGSDAEWYPMQFIGLQINLPLFSSGGRLAKTAQARMELDKVRNLKYSISEGLKAQYENARSNLLTASDNLSASVINIELSERVYNNTLIQFKEGMASSLDLSQAQRQYFEAQGLYFAATLELLNAKYALDHILSK